MATAFPEGFPDILRPTVSVKGLDPKPEGSHHRLYVKLNGVDGFPLGLDEVDLLVLSEFVRNFADVFEAPHRQRRDGPHEVGVD